MAKGCAAPLGMRSRGAELHRVPPLRGSPGDALEHGRDAARSATANLGTSTSGWRPQLCLRSALRLSRRGAAEARVDLKHVLALIHCQCPEEHRQVVLQRSKNWIGHIEHQDSRCYRDERSGSELRGLESSEPSIEFGESRGNDL